MDTIKKVYLEPTSRCNLACVTCIRNSWHETFGDMEWSTYETLINSLANFPDLKEIAFAGFGEPLLHEMLPDMVKLAHDKGIRTGITTNATLLTPSLSARLIDAGLDQIIVSIDGTSDKSHESVRPGAVLNKIIRNIEKLNRLCASSLGKPVRIGIEFVAMKSNINDLPKLKNIANRIEASFVIVSNLLPFTRELQDEILYNLNATAYESDGSPFVPLWILPHIDWTRDTQGPLSQFMRQNPKLQILDMNLSKRKNFCPFIMTDTIAVAWHGGVSPCPPLLHSYSCFILNREKSFRQCQFGKLPDQELKEIWANSNFTEFRRRVRAFDFPNCTDCGDCDLAQNNETDCMGNPFPVCGDCLWARGILRCA